MSATSPSPAAALARVTAVEARLALRDPATVFFALLFPAVLLTVLGLVMPWSDQPYSDDPALAGITGITGYTPIVLALAVGTVALSVYPALIATYRGTGVLRRLSTTPLPPSRLLLAQVLVQVGTLLVAALLALLCGFLLVGVSLPEAPLVVLLAFLLTAAATFGIGSLIAARAPSAGSANAYGQTLYFISLFFAGVWLPLPIMPEAVRAIAEWTPLGAGAQAMLAGWVGAGMPWQELAALAGWSVIGIPLATKLFRWR
jgi:ABC-2 type transport system permease protein